MQSDEFSEYGDALDLEDWYGSDTDLEPPEESDPFWFSCAVIPHDQQPLLEAPDLAKIGETVLLETAGRRSGQLWGYVILPAAVHFVLEVEAAREYHLWVDDFKAASEKLLIERIQDVHSPLLDAITLFNPAWGEVIYRFWQDGYHTQSLTTPYAVSNRVADLLQKPVEVGLVEDPKDWPFSSYRG